MTCKHTTNTRLVIYQITQYLYKLPQYALSVSCKHAYTHPRCAVQLCGGPRHTKSHGKLSRHELFSTPNRVSLLAANDTSTAQWVPTASSSTGEHGLLVSLLKRLASAFYVLCEVYTSISSLQSEGADLLHILTASLGYYFTFNNWL